MTPEEQAVIDAAFSWRQGRRYLPPREQAKRAARLDAAVDRLAAPGPKEATP